MVRLGERRSDDRDAPDGPATPMRHDSARLRWSTPRPRVSICHHDGWQSGWYALELLASAAKPPAGPSGAEVVRGTGRSG